MYKEWLSEYPERPYVKGYEAHLIVKRTDGICLYLLPTLSEIICYNDGEEKVGTQSPSQTGWKSYWYKNGEWVFRSEASGYLGVTQSTVGGTLQAGVNILEPSKDIIDTTNGNTVWLKAFEFWKEDPTKIWLSDYPERPDISGYRTHLIANRTDGICLYLMPSNAELCYFLDSGNYCVGTKTTGWKSYWYQNGEWVFRSEGTAYLSVTPSIVVGGVLQAGVNILEPSKDIIDTTNGNTVWMEAFEFWGEETPTPEEPDVQPPEEENPDSGGGSIDDDWEYPVGLPYFSFNGVDCPDFLKVTSVGISVLPSLETNLASISRKYGVLNSDTTFGSKTISFEVMLINRRKSLFQMASELTQFLKGDNWKLSKLKVIEMEGKHMMAKVSNSVDLNDLQVAGSGTIEFVVPVPLWVDDEETVVESTSTSFTVENTGTHEVLPVFTLKMSSTGNAIEIKNTTTNKSFKVNYKFKGGDVLVFDMDKKSIKVNGEPNMTIFNIESDWLELSQGNNALLVNTSASTTVSFKALYE